MIQIKYPVVCFGEVLWDIFPTGKEPGGAPVNVAYHLHMHKKEPAVITCIGNDEDGRQLKNVFKGRGINTSYFVTDEAHETGKVYGVADASHNMRYNIVQPVAWDFIPWDAAGEGLVKEASCFVYGSLAARSQVSRNTLMRLLDAANKKVLDINLRPPHYNKETLAELLQRADILKMNEEELDIVAPWFTGFNNREDKIKTIADKLNLEIFIVTLGAKGALLYMDGKLYQHPGYKITVADTVGSGDAFLAGLLSKWMDGSSTDAMLDYASKLGAFVATKKGACPLYDPDTINEFSGGG